MLQATSFDVACHVFVTATPVVSAFWVCHQVKSIFPSDAYGFPPKRPIVLQTSGARHVPVVMIGLPNGGSLMTSGLWKPPADQPQ